jgi:hypothetical protein
VEQQAVMKFVSFLIIQFKLLLPGAGRAVISWAKDKDVPVLN